MKTLGKNRVIPFGDGLLLLLAVLSGCDPFVEHPAVEPSVPARHALKTINGRTYWSYCGIDDTSTNAVFRECACHFACAAQPPPGKPTYRTVVENYTPAYRSQYETLEKHPHPFAPHVVRWNAKRNYRAFVGKVDLDVEDHLAFVKRHPEVHAFAMMDEWDNDMFMFAERSSRFTNAAERAEWIARWGATYATNRYDYVRLARQYRDRAVELYAGIDWMTRACRGSISIDHLAAAWGAKDIQVETTNTSSGDYEYRWDVAAPFIRGAARQFQIPWGWFVAIYVNGYARDGSWHVNNVCWYWNHESPEMKPWCGVSPSLERRAFYWAYVNGANFVEPETPGSQFFKTDRDGKKTLTDRGEAFVRFHDFTNAHPDRGATYAPVAVLVPFARGYPAGGGKAWHILPYTVADHQTDGVFFTLIPGIHRDELRKTKGMEFCLHNSKYAMMYDVVCPDAPQKPAELLKALEAYPAALLTGEYPNLETLSPTFMKYIEGGGTLVVNRANLRAVRVPAKGGEPVRDGNGPVVATLYRVGRGRLFVSASDWMVKEFERKDAKKVVNATLAGDVRFPEIAAFLDRFQSEYFPARVEGDCLYGINRTPTGWWLWAFNNRGVTNYTDEYAQVDPAAKSDIRVTLKTIAAKRVRELMTGRDVPLAHGSFRYTIPAGDLAIFEITNPAAALPTKEPEISWSIMHPVAIDVDYMKRVVEKSQEYGHVDSFELCGLEQKGINALSLFERYPHVRAKVDRPFVERTRAALNAVCDLAHAAGKPVYFWHRENLVPPGLFEDVPELLDADGEFDLLGKAYDAYLRYKIGEAFRNCPNLDGLVLTLTESEYSVLHNSNQARYPAIRVVENLIGIFTDELGKRGKRLILRSFGDGEDHDKIIGGARAAARAAGLTFEIETKVTEADFVPWLPKNKYLKRDAPLTLGAECDALGEFLGAGYLPAAQVQRIREYVASAREEGASRYAIRIDRKGFSIFDSAHEVNLYAYMRFIRDPSATADGVIGEYARRRFGAAAAAMAPVLKSELELVRNINYVASNLTFHAFPITRDFKYVKAGGIFSLYHEGASLADMEPIWSILSDAHAPTHRQILAEKDRGVRLAEDGLRTIEGLKGTIPAPEYERQHRAFANAAVLARALRAYTRCVVAYFEDMKADRDEPTTLTAASADAGKVLAGLRGGPLDAPYLDGIGFFCTEFLREYRVERAMRRKLQRPDVYDFVIPGGIYDDGRVSRLMHAAHSLTKADRIVRYAGNNRFPGGRITVRLKAPETARIDVALDTEGTDAASACDVVKSWKDGVWTVSVGKKGARNPAILSIAARGGRSFTVHAWAGYSPEVHRGGDYTFMFKGHRGSETPKVQYSLSVRYGFPEFKFMDANGQWAGIMMYGHDYLNAIVTNVPARICPSVKDAKPWHHLAGVYDRGWVSLYLDGRLVVRAFQNREPPANEFEPLVGVGEDPGGHSDWRFTGEVRRPTYEERALSAEEIAAVYEKGLVELAQVKPAYRPFVFPEPPVKGELKAVTDYFARLRTNPPKPRKANCVAKIVKVNGIPRVSIDGEVVPGMAMMPSPHVDDAAAEFSCRDFAARGVRLFSNIIWGAEPQNKWWLGEGRYDFDWVDRRLMAMIRAAPEGWIFPRLKMDPPQWWAKENPGEYYCHQVRPESVKWRALRERMVRDFVTHVENSPYAAHVIGYHLGALYGSEWTAFPIPHKDMPTGRAERLAWLDARSTATADALLGSAHLVKELTGGNKIVGAFFGYVSVFQRDFQRVVRSPDLDFFCAPDCYEKRRGGDAGRSQVAAQASCRLHNKIFWIEADERTPYAKVDIGYRCETLDEAIQVAKRTIGYTLTEGWETWWFLLEGNDTFHDETLLDAIERGRRVSADAVFSAPPRTEADVAVFRRVQELDYGPLSPLDLDAAYGEKLYMRTLPAAGVAYDTYVFEDVLSPELPDYRVYVFPDARTMTPAERAAVRRLVERKGKTMVRFCAEREGTSELPNGGRRIDFRRPPSSAVLQRVFAEAGAHVWLDAPDIVSAGRGFLMVHAAKGGVKTVRLPQACDVREIYGLAPVRTGVTSFEEKLARGETRIYRLTPQTSSQRSDGGKFKREPAR